MNTFNLNLDLDKNAQGYPNPVVRLRKGDKAGTTIVATLYDHGTRLTTSGLTALMEMKLPDFEHYYRQSSTYSSGVVTVTVDESYAASVVGETVAYIRLYQGESVIASTEPFMVRILDTAVGEDDVPAQSYDDIIPATVRAWLAEHPEATTTVQDNSLTTAKYVDGSVTTVKIADNAVTSGKIADGAVGTNDLANNAVTSAKIADGGVATADLADEAVTTPKLATDSVLTAKIADQNVTDEKLAPNGVLAKADRLLGNVPSRTMEAAIVHTTDTHAAPPLGMTVYGRSVQDGTPTPSDPVAISSIGDVVACFASKNLFNVATLVVGTQWNGGSNANVGYVRIPARPNTTYYYNGRDYAYGCGYVCTNDRNTNLSSARCDGRGVLTTPSGCTAICFQFTTARTSAGATVSSPPTFAASMVTDKGVQIEADGNASEYAPFANDMRLIDLNNLNLRMLPDGTRDALSVDGSGNVTVTRNVGYVVIDGSNVVATSKDSSGNVWCTLPTAGKAQSNSSVIQPVVCDKMRATSINSISSGIVKDGICLSAAGTSAFVSGMFASTSNANEWLKRNILHLAYPLATATTESLGQIDLRELRSLPDGTCDELTIDADGNVVLTQRVGYASVGGDSVASIAGYTNYTTGSRWYFTGFSAEDACPSVMGETNTGFATIAVYAATSSPETYPTHVYCYGQRVYWVADEISSSAEALAWTKANQFYVEYKLANPKTIDLGRLTLPPMPNLASPEATVLAITSPATDVSLTYEVDEALSDTPRALSNILVGSKHAQLAIARDVFASKAIGVTIDGKTAQDGTPTPSAPVSLISVHEPILFASTDNLMPHIEGSNRGLSFVTDDDGSVFVSGAPNNNYAGVTSGWFSLRDGVTYTIDVRGVPAGMYVVLTKKLYNRGAQTMAYVVDNYSSPVSSKDGSYTFTAQGEYCYLVTLSTQSTRDEIVANVYIQITEGSSAPSTFVPNTGWKTTIDLDGHELRSLPDGTHDELTVDADGNVTLVQRVGVFELESSITIGSVATLGSYVRGAVTVSGNGGENETYVNNNHALYELCTHAPVISSYTEQSTHVYLTRFANNSTGLQIFALGSTAQDLHDAFDGSKTYYLLAHPKTIPLGRVALPKLPAPVTCMSAGTVTAPAINAQVTLDYERDLTIAINAIESAIADMA